MPGTENGGRHFQRLYGMMIPACRTAKQPPTQQHPTFPLLLSSPSHFHMSPFYGYTGLKYGQILCPDMGRITLPHSPISLIQYPFDLPLLVVVKSLGCCPASPVKIHILPFPSHWPSSACSCPGVSRSWASLQG